MTGAIVLVGFPGGMSSTLSVPEEIFSFALSRSGTAGENGAARYQIDVATPSDLPLDQIGFFQLAPTIRLEDCPSPDLIFLTGMSHDIEATLEENKRIIPWISRAQATGTVVAAVCPSQALLATAGLLTGKCSAVHWSLVPTFKESWPDVDWRSNGVVVDEGDIITCCGGAAATDLALYAVYRLLGEEIALECARWFVSEMPRTRYVSPTQIFEAPVISDEGMKVLQEWLHTHYSEGVKFGAMADRFNMTERTFYRHFKKQFGQTPRVYLQKLRIASAQNLLEASGFTVDEISRKVGYDDALFFRKLFKRYVYMTPTEYREKYRFRALDKSRADLQRRPTRDAIGRSPFP